MKEKVLLISYDGLSKLDYPYINKLPNFKKMMEISSVCKNVETIYPSLTYPAHTSIVTGKLPIDHGVVNNTIIDLKHKNPDWYWSSNHIKTKTIYDEAIEKGYTVASLLWPVTANSKIQYNMPEIFSNRWWQNQILVSAFSGSLKYQLDLNRKFSSLRDGIKQPHLDNFVHESLKYTIKNYRPDLMMVHYTDLDFIRHEFGFNSEEAKEALNRHDKRLGEIVEVLEGEGVYDNTSIIIFGDHSSIDTHSVIFLNKLFYDNAYLKVKNNKIIDYKVLAKTCDGSTYVYIKDKSLTIEVKTLLNNFFYGDNNLIIEKILEYDQIKEIGADSNAGFMIEAKEGYYFSDEINKNIVESIESLEARKDKRYLKSSHGYIPTKKDYKSLFVMKENGKSNYEELESMSLIDIYTILREKLNL